MYVSRGQGIVGRKHEELGLNAAQRVEEQADNKAERPRIEKKGKRRVWFDDYEDGQYLSVSSYSNFSRKLTNGTQQGLLMDAQRVSDESFVYLKRMEQGGAGAADELQICQFLSSEAMLKDPRNHCVPIIEELRCSNGESIMVMPFLRPFYNPKFQTFGEAVAFFIQLFEVCLIIPCRCV